MGRSGHGIKKIKKTWFQPGNKRTPRQPLLRSNDTSSAYVRPSHEHLELVVLRDAQGFFINEDNLSYAFPRRTCMLLRPKGAEKLTLLDEVQSKQDIPEEVNDGGTEAHQCQCVEVEVTTVADLGLEAALQCVEVEVTTAVDLGIEAALQCIEVEVTTAVDSGVDAALNDPNTRNDDNWENDLDSVDTDHSYCKNNS